MKNSTIKNRVFWIAGFIALIICFFICRYASYASHGNKQWSVVLFIVGFIALCISAIFNGKKVMISIIIGYIGGLALGIIFNTYSVDQGGGSISNGIFIMNAPNPINFICDYDNERKIYIARNKLPYKSFEHDNQGDWIEYGHTLESYIGGQIQSGFVITGFVDNPTDDLVESGFTTMTTKMS